MMIQNWFRRMDGRADDAIHAVGLTPENPLELKSDSIITGMMEQYLFIERRHGREGKDWEKLSQKMVDIKGRRVDILSIRLRNGLKKRYYFDLTPFYKFIKTHMH